MRRYDATQRPPNTRVRTRGEITARNLECSRRTPHFRTRALRLINAFHKGPVSNPGLVVVWVQVNAVRHLPLRQRGVFLAFTGRTHSVAASVQGVPPCARPVLLAECAHAHNGPKTRHPVNVVCAVHGCRCT